VENPEVSTTLCGACALAPALLLACGGKSVTAGETLPNDASTADVSAADVDASTADRSDAPAADGRDALEDEITVLVDAPRDTLDAVVPWDHTCWCRNWTDDAYPMDFFDQYGCVAGPPCPPPRVCCAVTCTSPDFCTKSGAGFTYDCKPGSPKDCCHKVNRVFCMDPDQCAPEGVLHQAKYDSSKNAFPMCINPTGYDAGF
jgi:hypothetical protein